MKFLSVLTGAASVSAVAIRDATQGQVDVTLQAIGNHEVKATIQNNGNEDISFLKPGSIFDSSAVRKVKVTTGGKFLSTIL